jgi:hypothetical protein
VKEGEGVGREEGAEKVVSVSVEEGGEEVGGLSPAAGVGERGL